MLECVFTVGLPGSGKSYWAHNQSGYMVIDSDEVRETLWGNANDQQNPNKVFETMFRQTCEALAAGQSVIYCATNISMKYRIHTLTNLKRKFPNVYFGCVVFNTTVEKCKEMNKARERQVPEYVIERQFHSFQFPVDGEGWDGIKIYTPFKYSTKKFSKNIWKDVKEFGSQDNPHHTLTLYDHLLATIEKVDIDKLNDALTRKQVLIAAGLHDIGKAYTRSYDDAGVAHYYSHAEVSAYLAMNFGAPQQVIEIVNYHMKPFDIGGASAWEKRLGSKLWHKIMVLHDADVAAK
jgi:putative nucleotidyltransferase with HDIG domain